MKTKNSFHRTPQRISEYVLSLCGDGSYIDLCAGDGALTNGAEIEDLTSIDIDQNLLDSITQGKRVQADLSIFLDFDVEFPFQADYILMNPPFENYKVFLEILQNVMERTGDCKAVLILPKKALQEVDFSKCIESHIVFNQVDFGTAIVDIVVLKINNNAFNLDVPETQIVENTCEKVGQFLNILDSYKLILGNTYQGKFLQDSYSIKNENNLVEWRTKFTLNLGYAAGDDLAVSTFFKEGFTPTLRDVCEQVQWYIRYFLECFTVPHKHYTKTEELTSFDSYDDFIFNLPIENVNKCLEFLDVEKSDLDILRTLSYRFYQDNKLFTLFELKHLTELANFDFDSDF
jgi:hypothetical protein